MSTFKVVKHFQIFKILSYVRIKLKDNNQDIFFPSEVGALTFKSFQFLQRASSLEVKFIRESLKSDMSHYEEVAGSPTDT